MADAILSVTVVNHLAIDISTPVDRVWGVILDGFVAARGWRETGYAIEPIDEPAAIYGGYRMRLDQDDRIVRITERDDDARRLSLLVDFLSAPEGLRVHATYHAQAAPGGARYTIDCHTRMGIEAPAGGARADVQAAVEGMKAHFEDYLTGYLGRVKASLEGVEETAK